MNTEHPVQPPAIVYFDIRARAEPIRLIHEELGISYVDERVPAADWPTYRERTPFSELPIYRTGAHEIPQSHAICRHLARVHGLYGNSEEERTRCDVVAEALADLNSCLGRAPYLPDIERVETRLEFIQTKLSRILGQLENYLLTNSHGPAFWVGPELTFVDLVAFAYLDCAGSMFPEAFAERQTLQKFCDEIAERTKIASYLDSPRRPVGIQYGPKGRIDARSREGWRP